MLPGLCRFNVSRIGAMHTAVTIDDHLIEKAEKLTGVHEPSALMAMAINALIEREAPHHPGGWGEGLPDLAPPPPHFPGTTDWCCPDA